MSTLEAENHIVQVEESTFMECSMNCRSAQLKAMYFFMETYRMTDQAVLCLEREMDREHPLGDRRETAANTRLFHATHSSVRIRRRRNRICDTSPSQHWP